MFEFDELEDLDPIAENAPSPGLERNLGANHSASPGNPDVRDFDFDALDAEEISALVQEVGKAEESSATVQEEKSSATLQVAWKEEARRAAIVPEAGKAEAKAPAIHPALAMQLRGVLQRACPTWRDGDVESAQARLQAVGVGSVVALSQVLHEEGRLNRLLRDSGLRTFRQETMAAWRARFAVAEPQQGRRAQLERSQRDGERKRMEDGRAAGLEQRQGLAAEAGEEALEKAGAEKAAREEERRRASEAASEEERRTRAAEAAKRDEEQEESAKRREAEEEVKRRVAEAMRKSEEERRSAAAAAHEEERRREVEAAEREEEEEKRRAEEARREEERRAAEAASSEEEERRRAAEAASDEDRRAAEEEQRGSAAEAALEEAAEGERCTYVEAEREAAKAAAAAEWAEEQQWDHLPGEVGQQSGSGQDDHTVGEQAEVPSEALDFVEQVVQDSFAWSDQVVESFVSFDLLFKGVKGAEAGDFSVVTATVFKETKNGVSQVDFQIRLPAGADVATLRSVLSPALSGYVKVLGEAKGASSIVPLWDTELVPSNVVLSDFPGRPNKFYARFSIRECREAHRMVRDFFRDPENQQKIEDITTEASGDETRYQMLLVNLLTREVYPEILQRFDLPEDVQPFQTLVHCFVTSYMDYEVCKLWFESEMLMRNRRKCSQAHAYLAYHCQKCGLPPPTTARGAEALANTLSEASAGLQSIVQSKGGSLRGDGHDHVRLLPASTNLVVVDIPWAWRLAKRMPFVVGVVDGVFSHAEADALRELVEARGHWKFANGKGRTGLISELHIHGLARELWSRMAGAMSLDHGDKRVSGLSQHLRFLKYGPGHFFAPHEDGAQNCTNEEGIWTRSIYSALLYLSDPEEGGVPGAGGTRFISPDCPACNATGRCEEACEFCVDAPVRKGSVLLFVQSVLHAGTMPRMLEKFVMRTDVMFSV